MAFYYYPRKFLLKTLKSDNKYEACYMCYVCPDDCTKYLSPPPPFSPAQKHQVSPILIIMLCLLGAAFLILSYLTIGRYRTSTRNSRSDSTQFENNNFAEDLMDENRGPFVNHPIWFIRTVGLSKSVIDSIEVFKYKKGEKVIEGCDCSICLSEFEEDESLKLLPKCSHAFHVHCIDTWLSSHKNCPVCRAPILITDKNPNQFNASVSDAIFSNSGSGSRDEPQRENEQELERIESIGTRDLIETQSTNGGILSRNEKVRVLSDLADHRVKFDQEFQTVRRSASVDFSSASLIYHATANSYYAKRDEGCSNSKSSISIEERNSDMIAKRGGKNSGIYRLIKSYSHGLSIQIGPVSMKRSFSFTGKRSLRKHSRSLESIPTPVIAIP